MPAASAGNLELLHQILQRLAQIQARFLQRQLARFRLREQQQRAHNLREPVDILQRVEHGLAVLLGGLGGEERHFKLAANGRDGRAQFVRNVGGELLDLLERRFQPLDHAVEREDQVIEFIARLPRRNAQAQVRARDALRRSAPRRAPAQRAARNDPAQHRVRGSRTPGRRRRIST